VTIENFTLQDRHMLTEVFCVHKIFDEK